MHRKGSGGWGPGVRLLFFIPFICSVWISKEEYNV